MPGEFNPHLTYRPGKGRFLGWILLAVALAVLLLLAIFVPPPGQTEPGAGILNSFENMPLFWAAFGLVASLAMAVILKKLVLPCILLPEKDPCPPAPEKSVTDQAADNAPESPARRIGGPA